MTKYTGKGVYGAVAMGKISVFKKQDTAIKRIHTEDSEGEKKRVAEAKQAATEQLQSIYDKALREVYLKDLTVCFAHLPECLVINALGGGRNKRSDL